MVNSTFHFNTLPFQNFKSPVQDLCCTCHLISVYASSLFQQNALVAVLLFVSKALQKKSEQEKQLILSEIPRCAIFL